MNESNRPVALITGSGTGVGRACALQFAKRGFDVVVNYSRSEADAKQTAQEVESLGVRALVICCDVSNDLDVRAMLRDVEKTFGRLDILVNNAATTKFIPYADMESLTEELWDRIFAVNLKGAFFVTRAAADLLRAGEGGSVVNITSVAATTGTGSSIAYCASKAGLNTMTKSFAKSLAPNVRVNAVCPGPIDTRWIKEGAPSLDLGKMVAGYPLPKASQPDDIADAVIFLAIGTTMATGQLLTIDGGQTL
jgi:3-oxoacyl-[acyl-carrier protein] reductase